MISVEMEDVLAVLQLCKPYLIAIGVALVLGLAAVALFGKLPQAKRGLFRTQAVIAMVVVIAICVNLVCFGPMATLIGLATGDGQITDATNDYAAQVAENVMDEGIVLLENDGLLPLTDVTNVNLFGWESVNPAYGGAGSGGINDLYEVVSLIQGLENAGFSVNQDLIQFYQDYSANAPEMSIQKQSWTLPEPPVSAYPEQLMEDAKEFSDVAVVVISRKAGEGHNDIPTDVSKAGYDNNSSEYADFEEGEHYLQLSRTEEDLVEMVCENFEKVIVVYNGANQFELGFVEEYRQIQGVLWCAGTGNRGFLSLGKILRGDVNPSGRTPDIFMYDMTKAPWWNNNDQARYTNLEHMAVDGMNAGKAQVFYPSFTNYVEGIYVGYKYYETASAEGAIDYEKEVQYPFGYGLSYTTFTQEMGPITEKNGTISFDVTVTNTGSAAGKDVVEAYFNPPYTNGGIEKASANLVEFAKTGLLEPGASETITISFAVEDMASYDYQKEKAYVLEKGDYIISINLNSHEILDSESYTLEETVVYSDGRESDELPATNVFDDARGEFTVLSRANKFANLKKAIAAPSSAVLEEPYLSGYHLNSNYDPAAYLDNSDTMPVTGADNGLKLADLRGAAYDDERWEQLVQQMTIEEMQELIAMAGYQTSAVESVGKVRTLDFDGPAAINNNFTGVGSMGFPIEVVIASTWNKDLAQQWGECMGQMSQEIGAQGWYAPGMNTHRTPFGARNYEYFSEDGVLSGKLAAYAVTGAMEYGVYSYIKHYAFYEGNGKMVSVWADEQTLREIYLKPFELSVKDGGANAVMVSWSFLGNKWTGENSSLMNTVLREEWGFEGMALTDFFRNNGHGFMNADAALANGVDAMLSTFDGPQNNVTDPSHPTAVKQMQRASKNILFTVASSWAYDGNHDLDAAPGWYTTAIVADVLLAAALVVLEVLSVKKYRKRKTEASQAS